VGRRNFLAETAGLAFQDTQIGKMQEAAVSGTHRATDKAPEAATAVVGYYHIAEVDIGDSGAWLASRFGRKVDGEDNPDPVFYNHRRPRTERVSPNLKTQLSGDSGVFVYMISGFLELLARPTIGQILLIADGTSKSIKLLSLFPDVTDRSPNYEWLGTLTERYHISGREPAPSKFKNGDHEVSGSQINL
jgi:hypothetical protein